MSKRIAIFMSMVLLHAGTILASAGHDHVADGQASLSIEERLRELEENQIELYHTLTGKKEAGIASRIAERISLSGLLEVEGGIEQVRFEGGNTDSASDLVLATAQLTLGVVIAEPVTADLSVLYEQGETDLEVDEATINFDHGPWSGRVGQQYLPFGVFHSHFISDPLILDLGETRSTAVLAGYGNELLALSAFVFNGPAEESRGENHLDDWGVSLVLNPTNDLSLGGSYLSDLADSDADLLGGASWSRRVGGWSAFSVWQVGRFNLSGEILGAVRSFHPDDLDADLDGDGDRPLAWNLESSWDLRENLELAVRLEGSREFFGQPERQYGVDISWAPWERVNLSLEYLRGEFDRSFSEEVEGNPPDRRDLVTAQLAVEF